MISNYYYYCYYCYTIFNNYGIVRNMYLFILVNVARIFFYYHHHHLFSFFFCCNTRYNIISFFVRNHFTLLCFVFLNTIINTLLPIPIKKLNNYVDCSISRNELYLEQQSLVTINEWPELKLFYSMFLLC